MSDLGPITREVRVDADPATAFTDFTDRIGAWWPMAGFSVHGAGTVAFLDGELVETSSAGERAVWGTVTAWEPPQLLAFTWHPGEAEDAATRISVTVDPSPDGAAVTLVHDGWSSADARDSYGQGWVEVLEQYRRFTAGGKDGAA